MQKFEFQTKVIDKTAQVTIVGEVTAGNALQFKQQLLQAIQLQTPTILLDLSSVKRMDSAGVAVLIECYRSLRNEGRKLGLVRIPSAIRKILDLLGTVDVVFDIYSDMEQGRRMTAGIHRLHDPTKKITH